METIDNFWLQLQDGGTPLFVACQCGHLDVVEGLIERGASPNSYMKVSWFGSYFYDEDSSFT